MSRFARSGICCIALLCGASGCHKAPLTGRTQLILLPERVDAMLGDLAFASILETADRSSNVQHQAMVRRVGEPIAAVSGKPDLNWRYEVFAGALTVNAFALPGGVIGVYAGMIPIASTDAGLATVIGHEVGHVIARHGAERMSSGAVIQLGHVAILAGMRDRDPAVVRRVLEAYAVGTSVGASLPFSRQHESEADRIGLILMSKAGYDPREAVRFWERMDQVGPFPTVEFLSTHPSHRTRIANLHEWMPEALSHYQERREGVGAVVRHRMAAMRRAVFVK